MPSAHISLWKNLPDRLQKLCIQINRQYYKRRQMEPGIHVMKEDWDMLVILDAARPDILRTVAPSWPVETRYSRGTESWQFMRENFVGREFHDTVYITANPHAEKLPSGTFHDLINLLDTDWDKATGTVLPNSVVAATLEAVEKYPEKRIISHFMQPHFPFLGKTGREIEHSGIRVDNRDHPWYAAMFESSIDSDMLLDAFRENHEIVIPEVNKLVDEFDGKVIITADHANLIGERGKIIPIRLFGHPGDFPHQNLRTVPWIEFEADIRRQVSADPPTQSKNLDEGMVEERLKDLGYR